MTPKQISQQLKNLSIHPRKEWVDSQREFLLSQISTTSKTQVPELRPFFVIHILKNLIPMPQTVMMRTLGVAVLLLMVVGSGYITTVSASYGSVPGDTLYAVKRIDEEVRLNLIRVVNIEKAGELEIAYAYRRIDEAQKIISTSDSVEDKTEKVRQAVDQVQRHMENISQQIKDLTEQGKNKEASSLASKIDEEAHKISLALEEKTADIVAATSEVGPTDGDVADAVDKTAKVVDKISLEAVDVIVNSYVAGDSDISAEDLNSKLAKRIEELRTKVTEIFAQEIVDEIGVTDIKNTSDSVTADAQKTTSPLVLSTVNEDFLIAGFTVKEIEIKLNDTLILADSALLGANVLSALEHVKVVEQILDELSSALVKPVAPVVDTVVDETPKIEDNVTTPTQSDASQENTSVNAQSVTATQNNVQKDINSTQSSPEHPEK